MANEYEVGQAVTLKTEPPFRDGEGVALDPSTVTLEVKKPDGTRLTALTTPALPAITNDAAAGVYTATLVPNVAGRWWYRWLGVGPGNYSAADANYLEVKGTGFH